MDDTITRIQPEPHYAMLLQYDNRIEIQAIQITEIIHLAILIR